jgi:muramoyltetrapeptide carboxypeptidase
MIKIFLLFLLINLFNTLQPLKEGDKALIISPSGAMSPDGANILRDNVQKIMKEKWKLNVDYGQHVFERTTTSGGFAGIDKNRLNDLERGLYSKEYKVVFCTRGGYGINRILVKIFLI